MALKRFTDAMKWKDTWFSDLPNDGKLMWFYLLDQCNEAGIWDPNFKLASFQLGFLVNHQTMRAWFSDKAKRLPSGKYWIPAFITFQYGEKLSPDCKPHKKVIEVLNSSGIDPETLTLRDRVSGTLSDTVQEEEKDKDKDKEEEKEEEKEPPDKKTQRFDSDLGRTRELSELWVSVLKHYGAERPLLETERIAIARAIQHHGAQAVRLAFLGQRYEPASDEFKPNRHLSLTRIFNPLKFERFVNLGAQADQKLKALAEKQQREELWEQARASS